MYMHASGKCEDQRKHSRRGRDCYRLGGCDKNRHIVQNANGMASVLGVFPSSAWISWWIQKLVEVS